METDTTYIPPVILNDTDEETIHARMLGVIPSNMDKTEGGFVWDFTRPTALEKADAMVVLNEVVQLFFPEWSGGEFLDKLGVNDGLTRKKATAAEATLEIVGLEGMVINAGFVFSTAATAISENVEFVAVESVVLDGNGYGEVLVRCTQSGTIGNVAADSIVLMASPLSGIVSLTNPEAARGGTDVESDDDYRQRIMSLERDTDSSFVGCDADYRRWATECDGVGTCIVMPEWNGAGTVKLIIMDANREPATQTILDNVYNYIVSPDDRSLRLAPIGATVTVGTADVISLTIAATITKDEDHTVEEITAAFREKLIPEMEKAVQDGVLRWTRVGAALSETEGVIDYDPDTLLIDGDAENIEVALDEYPVATTVTLTVEAS